jgi:tetratricopeptide (TPR) repeat protein
MDADEMLDPAGAERIAAILADNAYPADAVELTLANYCDDPRAWRWIPVEKDNPYAGGHIGYLEVPLLRLFRNHKGYEYREAVHENITESVLEKGGNITREDILIHHYGYTSPKDDRKEKVEWYLSLARKKLESRPDDKKSLHDFAEQALACGLEEEAESACRKILSAEPLDLRAATTLANILLNRGNHDQARTILLRLETAIALPRTY